MVSNFKNIRYIDLFCGIGGFRYGMEFAAYELGIEADCVFSLDIDKACADAYEANFNENPYGDIKEYDAKINLK